VVDVYGWRLTLLALSAVCGCELQVQEGMATILDTMPKGAGGGGGLSREEIVDRICEDLLSKVGVAGCDRMFCA